MWKLALCLREFRPDLRMLTVLAPPTGLCMVSGLDQASTLLSEAYEEYVARNIDLDVDDYRMRLPRMPPWIPNHKTSVTAHMTGVTCGVARRARA